MKRVLQQQQRFDDDEHLLHSISVIRRNVERRDDKHWKSLERVERLHADREQLHWWDAAAGGFTQNHNNGHKNNSEQRQNKRRQQWNAADHNVQELLKKQANKHSPPKLPHFFFQIHSESNFFCCLSRSSVLSALWIPYVSCLISSLPWLKRSFELAKPASLQVQRRKWFLQEGLNLTLSQLFKMDPYAHLNVVFNYVTKKRVWLQRTSFARKGRAW